MSETPPDRLSNDPASDFFDEAALERGIGIRFNGAEKTNVEEYCVSEGWIRVSAGKAVDRKGRPMTLKLKGVVAAYFRDGNRQTGLEVFCPAKRPSYPFSGVPSVCSKMSWQIPFLASNELE